jgi:hypothetical protein
MTLCIAVGDQPSGPLVERWNGREWSVERAPAANQEGLEAVSCATRTFCIAVGSDGVDGMIADRWNGRTWSATKRVPPSGVVPSFSSASSSSFDVSCKSANACTAVWTLGTCRGASCNSEERDLALSGSVELSTAEVDRWNGTSWSAERIATRKAWVDTSLDGVSCSSTAACTAVGSWDGNPLVERWNGTRWSIQRPVERGGGSGRAVSDVSCPSSSSCVAVGYFGGGVPAERWNGTSWSVEHLATRPAWQHPHIDTVSCASTGACVVLGAFTNTAGNEVSLVEDSGGSEWSILRPPLPADATGGLAGDAYLAGASCTTPAVCMMVGSYTDRTGQSATWAVRWHRPTWSLQQTVTPPLR